MKNSSPELWTLSGINNWSVKTGGYEDYVGAFLLEQYPAHPPKRRYKSRLGITAHYPRERNVLGRAARKKLDREARAFARGEGDNPAIQPGMFRGRKVKVMLVAPKTNTPPPNARGLCVEIYWAPFDSVPNQRLFAARRWEPYKRGSGRVWPVRNPAGRGWSRGHDFEGFMQPGRTIIRRVRRRSPGRKGSRFVWRSTGKTAPDALDTLREWLMDRTNDYVLVAHSQGTNMAMHLLQAGY